MTSKVIYKGKLHTDATHIASNTTIVTDAPVDNGGNGSAFSPTDLVATALASCMLTIIGKTGETHGFSIEGTVCEVEKIMAANPRGISAINIKMTIKGQPTYSAKEKQMITNAAKTCPVWYSLNADMEKNLEIIF